MAYTSSEANKLLRKLKEELEMENESSVKGRTFTAAIEENIEDVRPEFSLSGSESRIDVLEKKIRTVKHAINEFNVTNKISDGEGGRITIDEALVLIPMLTAKKKRLSALARMAPKSRHTDRYVSGRFIEYDYANFSIDEAKKMLEATADRLTKVQLALDEANNTITMEIDLSSI